MHTCHPTPWRPQQHPMTPQFNVVMWNLYLEVYRYNKLRWRGYKCSSIYSSTTPTYLSIISPSAMGLPTIHPFHLLEYHCPHQCPFDIIRTPHASHLCLMNSFLSCFLVMTWRFQHKRPNVIMQLDSMM